ncbi:MAG TPA: hypothetical protein VFO10_10045 [Oligoflexus sp.]|uniref:hypothetical protein n=1 Tax=Oligoflexus sp. TaxID=1971216 RepID=UPI002D7F7D09|nr:hypothetical protein [Oligoflexus sp.]HET9237582.1 hypothetical protein [Oligoflexus sp.]
MKKVMVLALVILGFLAFWLLRKPEAEPQSVQNEPRSEETRAEQPRAAPMPTPTQVAPKETVVPEPVERDWMALTLQHKLTPESLEAWAKKEGLTLKQETKGHPASGERLEMSWGQEPVTTAVFDILGAGRYQLSAVRSLYPPGSELKDLKVQMQHVLSRPIEREDARTVVFRADDEGMIVWMAQEDDGRIKLAFEYGAHPHEAP